MTRLAASPPDDLECPVATMRRGSCPSLSAPMQTGDGLLIRLRPEEGWLSPRQLRDIAVAAGHFGNGILEVTARGNLQVRGLSQQTAAAFADAVLRLDLTLAAGVAIEMPPLCGIDPAELADPRPLVRHLRAALQSRTPALLLAPKLSVIVDGGGRFHLGGIVADIRLGACRDADGKMLWRLAIAGTAQTAITVAVLEAKTAIDAVLMILQDLHDLGPSARGRDLDAAGLRHRLGMGGCPAGIGPAGENAPPAGIHDFGAAGTVLGLGLTYCQTAALDLIAFLDDAEALGAEQIRMTPDHGLFVLGLSAAAACGAQARAAAHGFRIRPDDPANHIALCAGSRGCASASFDTHQIADAVLAAAPDLLDGSMKLHISGCRKGCAHPAAADLTLTAAPTGYGLVVNGSASGSPDGYIAANDVTSAFRRLGALVRSARKPGDMAGDGLSRLGAERIGEALRQGRE